MYKDDELLELVGDLCNFILDQIVNVKGDYHDVLSDLGSNPTYQKPVQEAVSYRGLFTAGWFGVREKYCSRLEIYDRLRPSEQAEWLHAELSCARGGSGLGVVRSTICVTCRTLTPSKICRKSMN